MCNDEKNTPKKEKEEITGKFTLRLDKDFDKLMEMSEKTGVPLNFRGDRIIDFKINGISKLTNFKPDQIKIGPPAFYFDLKFGDEKFNQIPFDRIVLSENIVVFKSLFYSKLDINLKIKFKVDKINCCATLNINISPKSNTVKDILNYELRKREFSDKTFQLIPFSDENQKIEGTLPSVIFDDEELNFYKKANKINDKLNLDLILDDDYIITNEDFECADMICSFINTKKIKINNIALSMKTPINMLKEFIHEDKRQMLLKQDSYILKFLGNDINLGPCQVNIKQYEILNKEELEEIYNKNIGNTNLISVKSIIKEFESDELYLGFNID